MSGFGHASRVDPPALAPPARRRAWILALPVALVATLAAWGLVESGVDRNPDLLSPPDVTFTWLLLAMWLVGLASGAGGRDIAGWIGAAIGLVLGLALAGAAWSIPNTLRPEWVVVQLVPLTVGYAMGAALRGSKGRDRLVVACAVGLWLPFAALAGLGALAAISSPGLGENDWVTVLAAILVTVLLPVGLWLWRDPATRSAGRALLAATGFGVAAWALLDGGYGRPLWDAAVSPPLIAVMLAGLILGGVLALASLAAGSQRKSSP